MGKKGGGPAKAEKDRSERWLLTYADLITLLLIFFVVLYSMAEVSKAKFDAMASSLSIIFGGVGRSGVLDGGRSVIPGQQVYKEHREMQNTEERTRRMIAKKGLESKVSTILGERGLTIRLMDSVLFDPGSADLKPAARDIMQSLVDILADLPNAVRVEGHTDTVPIHTPKFFSNWELSTARATNVLQFILSTNRIAPQRMSAAGYGEYKPIVPNSRDQNRAINRRVDIVILSGSFSKFEPETLPTEGVGPDEMKKDDRIYRASETAPPEDSAFLDDSLAEPEEF
ncbi:MAG: OmpA family protein [Chitinispirillaceae bacterium]|jgi:chemotaxis protein MotB|nr:OmpA family protein [Chitinispirillaceae bacterium]